MLRAQTVFLLVTIVVSTGGAGEKQEVKDITPKEIIQYDDKDVCETAKDYANKGTKIVPSNTIKACVPFTFPGK